MGFREALIEVDGVSQRIDSFLHLPVSVVRKCQLVQHVRRLVVQHDERLVVFRRLLVPSHRGVDVAQQFNRTRRGGVERGGFPQVPERRRELTAPAVGIAPFQVGQHRVALQGQRAAEGLDRPVGLALA